MEEVKLVGALVLNSADSHSLCIFVKAEYFVIVQDFYFLLKLRVAEVNTLGTDVFVSEHAAQNVTLCVQILNRNHACFV